MLQARFLQLITEWIDSNLAITLL